MKRLFNLLLVSSLLLTISSCGKKKSNKNPDSLSKYQPIVEAFDSSKMISRLQFENIPDTPIEIGYFSSSGIILEAIYTDGTSDRMHLTEGMFSKEQLKEFQIPGKKKFDFVYRNNHIPLEFELVEAENPVMFTVRFLDKDGNLLDSKLVKYLSNVTYSGKKDLDYTYNNKYYKFDNKWDKNLDYIYSNIDTKPIYKECDIENSFDDYYKENRDLYKVVKSFDESNLTNMLVYIGRINNATLVSYDSIKREHYKDTELVFERDNISRIELNNQITSNLNNTFNDIYYHEQNTRAWYNSQVFNAYLLNLSGSNPLLRDFSDCGFNSYDLKPIERSNYNTSYKSVLNHLNVDPYNLYTREDSNKINLLEDDNLGNYVLSLMSDLDCYLYIKYEKQDDYGAINYYLKDAKIVLSYVPETLKMAYKSSDDDFTSYSNQLKISNGILADTIYEYLFFSSEE